MVRFHPPLSRGAEGRRLAVRVGRKDQTPDSRGLFSSASIRVGEVCGSCVVSPTVFFCTEPLPPSSPSTDGDSGVCLRSRGRSRILRRRPFLGSRINVSRRPLGSRSPPLHSYVGLHPTRRVKQVSRHLGHREPRFHPRLGTRLKEPRRRL